MMRVVCIAVLGLLLAACSGGKQPVRVDHYTPVYRTSPPDSIYSRVMWSFPPHPVKPRAKLTSPFILPIVDFDMPNATFSEAIEALAQSMGYRWEYPRHLARRTIRLRMEGDVEEVLAAISKQARVKARFDHENRLVRVFEKEMVPRLPSKK